MIGGNETPGMNTYTPGLITFPPMIVAPILTVIGPTFGGTNVSTGDPEAGGDVSASALLTGAVAPTTPTTAAAAHNFRNHISISCLPSRSPGQAGPMAGHPPR
jgi:hypothetical protein